MYIKLSVFIFICAKFTNKDCYMIYLREDNYSYYTDNDIVSKLLNLDLRGHLILLSQNVGRDDMLL